MANRLRKNWRSRKEARKESALERQKARAQRTDTEQLAIVMERGKAGSKEAQKLMKRIDAANAPEPVEEKAEKPAKQNRKGKARKSAPVSKAQERREKYMRENS